jgi:hypothetical protein
MCNKKSYNSLKFQLRAASIEHKDWLDTEIEKLADTIKQTAEKKIKILDYLSQPCTLRTNKISPELRGNKSAEISSKNSV